MTNEIDLDYYWYTGVIVAITGCLIDATGWMIEKKSHIQLQEKCAALNKSESVKYLCSGYWWCGFIIHSIGTIIFAISLGLGKQSLITPLQSFTLLFNAIFAWKFLKEKLSKIQIFGTITIIIGCAFTIAFGPKYDNQIHTAHELKIYFRNPIFLIFISLIICVFFVNYIMYRLRIMKRICRMFSNANLNIDETVSSTGSSKTSSFSMSAYCMFCEIGFSAFFGSWSALFTKCTVEIFGTSAIFGADAGNWSDWFTYICLGGMVVFAVLLEYWRQESLKHYPANNVSSIYNTLLIIFGVAFGAAFFGEFDGMTWFGTVLFILSVAVSIIGVLLLTLGDRRIKTKAEICLEMIVLGQEMQENIDEANNRDTIGSQEG